MVRRAVRRHGVSAVDAKIEQRVLELRWIDLGGPEPAGAHDFQLYRGADAAADKLLHAVDQLVDVRGLGIQRLPAREGEQSLGQGRCPTGAGLGRVDIAFDASKTAFVEPLLQ
jgi:hypothetical protein